MHAKRAKQENDCSRGIQIMRSAKCFSSTLIAEAYFISAELANQAVIGEERVTHCWIPLHS